MKRKGRVAIAVGVGLSVVALALATTHPLKVVVDGSWANAFPTTAQMAANADAVVEGTVVDESGVEVSPQADNLIYTNYTFKVDKWIRGTGPSRILIHQMGGSAGLRQVTIPDDPPLSAGDSNILFLMQYATGRYFIMGGPTGRIMIQNGVARPLTHSILELPAGDVASLVQSLQGAK
jgi:hypothetical protein